MYRSCPRLAAAIPFAVSFIGCEDAQELIQDATAMAARMMHNAEKTGKKVTRSATGRISAGNIAYYTLQHLKSGRRSNGFVTADVYGAGTQINGRTRLNSLDKVVAEDQETGGEIFLLHDVLADHHQEDPTTKATRKMDWEEFVEALPERERVAIEFMTEGKTLREAAHALRVSDSAMQQSKRYLRVKILEFMGANILAEVNRQPQWRQNLDATRKRMAMRYDRCH